MALAALIQASRLAEDEGEALRATLPLAGRTLIEHQARLAARAGADHIIVVVERVPPSLVAALDRLRQAGLHVDMARSVADAADRIHPDESLLVIADGCIAGPALVGRIAEARPPAVLTVPDETGREAFERIDAGARWGGLMLIDGALLRDTAAMLGDWDLESTLLRRAMQAGAARIDIASVASRVGEVLLLADRATSLEGFDRAMLAAARPLGRDWPSRYIFPHIEKLCAPPLLRRGVDPVWFAVAAVTAAIVAAIIIAAGWWLAGYAALLISGPIAAVADRLAGARLSPMRQAGAFPVARAIAATVALLLLTAGIAEVAGWGTWVITATLLAAMAALAGERRILARLPGGLSPPWIASADGLAWAMLPFAVAGYWLAGLVALALYAAASFAFVQREVASRAAVRSLDPA